MSSKWTNNNNDYNNNKMTMTMAIITIIIMIIIIIIIIIIISNNQRLQSAGDKNGRSKRFQSNAVLCVRKFQLSVLIVTASC